MEKNKRKIMIAYLSLASTLLAGCNSNNNINQNTTEYINKTTTSEITTEIITTEEVGDNFLKYNRWLEKFIAPNLRKIGLYILSSNNILIDVDISSLIDECKDNLSKYMKEMLKQETP